MLEHISLVPITPLSATVIRTNFNQIRIAQFCCKPTHIVQVLRQEEKIVVYKWQFFCRLCTEWTPFPFNCLLLNTCTQHRQMIRFSIVSTTPLAQCCTRKQS